MSKAFLVGAKVLHADNLVADNSFVQEVVTRLQRDGVGLTSKYLVEKGYSSSFSILESAFEVRPFYGTLVLKLEGTIIYGDTNVVFGALPATDRVNAIRNECIKTISDFMASFTNYAANDFKLTKNKYGTILLSQAGYINSIETNAIRLEVLAKIADHLKTLEDGRRTN